ncbi:MAG: cyclic nucleotide-binding domain-containing protein [Acidobacteria bacterium]|nr:cyclic nucleotide-binding domain-containing protein [Acidobacteriota bacterium]MCB9398741.1 cyclic nucleotide-binding domain-containing protein [Acidobacteriota bacterium]
MSENEHVETEQPGKTMLKRMEQYRDRWSSYGNQTGIQELSEGLTIEQLQKLELFDGIGPNFLEKMLPDISLALWRPNSVLFEEGSYIDLAFYVVKGEVEVSTQRNPVHANAPLFDSTLRSMDVRAPEAGQGTVVLKRKQLGLEFSGERSITFLASMDMDLPKGSAVRLGPGEFFGEIGALSGWPQSVTAVTQSECILIQIRLPALRILKSKAPSVKAKLDERYKQRTLTHHLQNTPLFSSLSDRDVKRLIDSVELVSCEPGQKIVGFGDPLEALYLVRSGFVKLTQPFGSGELLVSYLSKGMSFGEVELLVHEKGPWTASAYSVEYAELVKIPLNVLDHLLSYQPVLEDKLWRTSAIRVREAGYSQRNVLMPEFRQLALDSGLVQGTSILAIDLNRCTRCDDCVTACASTHGGRPRFIREGNKVQNWLIPKSCYHCLDPVCLVGCPTGSIHRGGAAEVIEIQDDLCIGCGACARNCPYDAIVMHGDGEKWPDDMIPTGLRGKDRLIASKCDLCSQAGHEPACVSQCPQGCATRVESVEAFQTLLFKED